MEPEPIIQHWLTRIAREQGLEQAESLDIPADTDLEGAWAAVALRAAVSSEELADLVARHFRLERADLGAVDPHAHRLVPGAVARRWNVVPLSYGDRFIEVATADPVSMETERELGAIASRSVRFRIAPPDELREAVERIYPESGELRHEVEPLPPEARGGPRVLVVDDDDGMRLLLRTTLEEHGFRVDEAPDGSEALEVLESADDVALVTLDLQMERMQGLEVLHRIRSRARTAHIPVIIATGSDDPAVEMRLFEAGADDFIVKPIDPPRFILRVQAVLRRRSSNPLAGLL